MGRALGLPGIDQDYPLGEWEAQFDLVREIRGKPKPVPVEHQRATPAPLAVVFGAALAFGIGVLLYRRRQASKGEAGTEERKPKRIWVLQIMGAVQLIGIVSGMASVVQAGLPETSTAALAAGFARPIVGTVVITAMCLSLQRLLPRPELSAPRIAALWWLLSLAMTAVTLIDPPSAGAKQFMFADVPTEHTLVGRIAGSALLYGGLLWAVASLFVHDRTQAYLRGKAGGAA